jgi:hypothetical protein
MKREASQPASQPAMRENNVTSCSINLQLEHGWVPGLGGNLHGTGKTWWHCHYE